jgi:hypothetical protein
MKLHLTQFARGAGFVLIIATAVVLTAPLVYGVLAVRSTESQVSDRDHPRPDATPTVGAQSPGPVATPSVNPQDLSAGFEAFTDLHRRTYTWIGIEPANKQLFGQFVFYVEGVGTFTPGTTAKVTKHSRNDVEVSYDGPGSVDAAAKMDLELDRSISQGTPTPILIRLDGHIDPDHHTAEINLWAGGKERTAEHGDEGDHRAGATHYQLVATRPESPTDAVNKIVRLTKAQDWSSLYELCDTSYRSLVSKDQWLQEEPAAFTSWLAGANLTDVKTSDITTPNGDAGYWTAKFTLTLTASGTAGTQTHSSTVILVYEATGWHMATGTNAQ